MLADNQCRALTRRGNRCRNECWPGSHYCDFHALSPRERRLARKVQREHKKLKARALELGGGVDAASLVGAFLRAVRGG
jgi:hypothetical protein